MAGCKNQCIMKYHSKLLVSNICHIEFWEGFPVKKNKQQPAQIRLQLNSGTT